MGKEIEKDWVDHRFEESVVGSLFDRYHEECVRCSSFHGNSDIDVQDIECVLGEDCGGSGNCKKFSQDRSGDFCHPVGMDEGVVEGLEIKSFRMIRPEGGNV